jgi:hypothetical protein
MSMLINAFVRPRFSRAFHLAIILGVAATMSAAAISVASAMPPDPCGFCVHSDDPADFDAYPSDPVNFDAFPPEPI